MGELRVVRVVSLVADSGQWANEFGADWTEHEARQDFDSYVDASLDPNELLGMFGSLAGAGGEVVVAATWAVTWAVSNRSHAVWCDSLAAAEQVARGLRAGGLECEVVAASRPARWSSSSAG